MGVDPSITVIFFPHTKCTLEDQTGDCVRGEDQTNDRVRGEDPLSLFLPVLGVFLIFFHTSYV